MVRKQNYVVLSTLWNANHLGVFFSSHAVRTRQDAATHYFMVLPFVKAPKRKFTTHFGMLRQSHTQHHMHSVILIWFFFFHIEKRTICIGYICQTNKSIQNKNRTIYHLNFHSQFLWLSATNRNSINCVMWITCSKSRVKWLAYHCSNWIGILKKTDTSLTRVYTSVLPIFDLLNAQ